MTKPQYYRLPDALRELRNAMQDLREVGEDLTTPLFAADAFQYLAGTTYALIQLAEKLQLRAARYSNGALGKIAPSEDQAEAAMQVHHATGRLNTEAKRLRQILNEVARSYYELEAVGRGTETEI